MWCYVCVCGVCVCVVNEGTVAPKGWLHMDVVEKEKLEWTCEVPAVDSSAFQKVNEGEE